MKILIAGDFCPYYRVEKLIQAGRYNDVFAEVKPIIESADYSLVNFECPIVESPQAEPIEKCGPNLRCGREAAEAIAYAGFKAVTLANNHVMDFGAVGLQDTIEACKANGLDIVGVGANLLDADKILYTEINGKTLGIINCCEHEFSTATENTPGANSIDPIRQFRSIKEARAKADYVIVIVHGGPEHYQVPSPRMKDTYRFYVDAGADAVINHHQHCYSGYEVYCGKPIFYGLGNFSFDWSPKARQSWKEGYMVELTMEEGISYRIIPYLQNGETPMVTLTSSESFKSRYSIQQLNDIIADDASLEQEYNAWMDSQTEYHKLAFTPYNNRYTQALYMRGWLPSFLSKNKRLTLKNYLNCESHKDIMMYLVNKKLN